MNKYEMVINGEVLNSKTYKEVKNPASTTSTVGLAPVASSINLHQAVQSAHNAFQQWNPSEDSARVAACHDIATVISNNAEELAQLITAEQGKPLNGFGSRFEVNGCVQWAKHMASTSIESKVLEDSADSFIEQRRTGMGVVASITPWNWPLLLGVAHILPAIRTGNTVVIKPSPYTPLSTLRLVQLMNDVLPKGVVNVLSGGDDLGAELTKHELIKKIVFTGSVATGKKVMASASAKITPITLELGGNDAGIVLPGSDISSFIERLFWGAMMNSGQTCAALKRLYVHEKDYGNVCNALVDLCLRNPVGDGQLETSTLGPLQNQVQYEKVISLVDDAHAEGANILCGGKALNGENYFYPPTIVAEAVPGMRIVDEEQFGPALPVIRYQNLEDVIAEANNTEFGLCASVWGQEESLLREVANKLEAGTVYINKHSDIAPHVPLGGIKSSGLGVCFGQEGLDSYTAIKIFNSAR